MCPDHETLVMFIDDELDDRSRAGVEAHVAGCESCREFVEEMRSLDARGRLALGAIRVTRAPIIRRTRIPYRALAVAAIVAVVISLAAWLALRPDATSQQLVAPAEVAPIDDDAFERWAAPYRELRIPLVPMEEVANYKPPPQRPFIWPDEGDGT